MKNELHYCVLIADDDTDDQYLIKEAFASLNFSHVSTVNNGEELFDYLEKKGKYAGLNIPFPKAILLDLNMPKKDGKESLKELKADSRFNKIPVVIFSTSNNPQDISQCYELGASSYIIKPSSYSELVTVMEIFKNYWFSAVKTPDINHG